MSGDHLGDGGREPRYRRSPFLLLEWRGRDLVVLNCDSGRRFAVDGRALALLSRLDRPAAAGDLAESDVAVSREELVRLAELGLLVETRDGEGERHDLFWNPYDLAVHRQASRGGFSEEVVLARGVPAPALVRPRGPGRRIPLPPPAEVLPDPFGEVLARRRSLRSFSERPLALGDLSTLLHHSAGMVRVFSDDLLGDQALRPFPAGGARSELELYIVASDVDGLPRGAHRYDPHTHELVHVRDPDDHQERLLRSVHAATGGALSRDPPAIILITAVFARVMWKYERIGLSLIYKNTGCLLQTLYLVATALGLSPCAVGGGEEVANSRWLGLDPLVEAQVGCFLVGSRPDPPS